MTYHNPSDCKYILMLSQERKPLKKIIDFRYFKTVFVSKTIGRGMLKKIKWKALYYVYTRKKSQSPENRRGSGTIITNLGISNWSLLQTSNMKIYNNDNSEHTFAI